MPTPTPADTRDLGPAVPFPPPILFVAGLGLGAVLDRLLPMPAVIPDVWWMAVLGGLMAVVGLTVVYTGILTFRRFRTSVYPNRPAKLVVDTGIYARTRNPMYLGLTIAYLGGVLLMGSIGTLMLLPFVLAALVTQVIRREERHLRERFPVEYADYCARVGRWL